MVNFSSSSSWRNKSIQNKYLINFAIKAKEVRLIDSDGSNLGVLNTAEALKMAREKEMDLLLIAPASVPPVAKIVDFNKFLYDERKKESSARARSKKSELKELRFTPVTGDGDIVRLAKRAKEFIEEGDKVKVSVIMKGRQAMFPDVAFNKLKKFENELLEEAKVETEPKRIGNTIWMVFTKK